MPADHLHSPTGQEDDSKPPGRFPVLVIYDVIDCLERGEALDLLADEETVLTARCIAEALQTAGHPVSTAAVRSEVELGESLAAIDPRSTLIFNMVEAMGGISGGEARIPSLLDHLGFYYTGSPARAITACLDKAYTKACLVKNGVPTAPYQVFRSVDEPLRVLLPAIVKPVAEDCSLGITSDSVVADEATLRRRVAYILEKYRQPALVEQYLEGREFKVSVWGNGTLQVLPLAEVDFSDWGPDAVRVVNFNAKWVLDSPEHRHLHVICPASVDAHAEALVYKAAMDSYRVMGCRDYARVDVRLENGIPYVLEVNTNPSLYLDSGFFASATAAGYDYPAMAHQIAAWAWARGDSGF